MNPRYIRQITLPEIGLEGQQKLNRASVLVVGAGGLGCPALLYLTAAGVGKIGIVDGDWVELSNLHRQVLYTEDDRGQLKAESAANRLRNMNSDIEVETIPVWLNRDNALNIIRDYDIIIDGTDNFPTRYLINDACVMLEKPFVYGSIYRFEGQVSLFNQQNPDGSYGPNYRDLYPEPPPAELIPDCSEAGVLGVLPGIIGTLQAAETIKWITGLEGRLNGKLLIFDALEYETRIIHIKAREDNPVSGKNPSITELIDYEQFCNPQTAHEIREISPKELQMWMKSEQLDLIDVRTEEERENDHIGGILVPHHEIKSIAHKINPKARTVFYCRTGKRSADAIKELNQMGADGQFYNLTGGIEAWKRVIS